MVFFFFFLWDTIILFIGWYLTGFQQRFMVPTIDCNQEMLLCAHGFMGCETERGCFLCISV